MDRNQTYKLQALSVAVVDDHEVVLEGMKRFLDEGGVGRVEVFSKGGQLLDRIAVQLFDVFIVDVELTDIDAPQLIDCIRACQPSARIIIHTMHEEMWVVNKMTEKHVDGVLYKSSRLEKLLEAIVTVSEGRKYLCDKFRKSQHELLLQKCALSPRELQVLLELARGNSTKEIASILYISENTVENHRKSLMRKLHAKNVASLIINAITSGYINPAEL